MSTTAEKVAAMIQKLLLEERKECAEIAANFDSIDASNAILNQPKSFPPLREVQHCFSCAKGVKCGTCRAPVMDGSCPGLES